MKKVLIIVLALAMVLSFAACTPAAETSAATSAATEVSQSAAAETSAAAATDNFDPSQYSVAICMPVYNHPVHRIVQLGFLKAAEALGYTQAKVIGTEGTDSAEEWAAATAFADEGGNAILLWAGDSSSFETIAYCAAAGLYVGVPHFNLKQEDGTYPEGLTFGMACNPTLYGTQVADLMAEKLDGMTGSVAITQNTKNVTENAATEGFKTEWDKLAADGSHNLAGITVLDPELEGAVVDEATAINLSIIQAHPDIIGAFGTTGNSPITWSDAATKAGKADGEIVIVGMDATSGNLQALKDGKVAALVAQPLYQEAYKTMEYFDTLFRGGTVPQWTDLEAPIVTLDGTDQNGPAYHEAIAAEVETFFQS